MLACHSLRNVKLTANVIWSNSSDLFELTIKVRIIAESRLKADLQKTQVGLNQQPRGGSDPKFGDICGQSAASRALEKCSREA